MKRFVRGSDSPGREPNPRERNGVPEINPVHVGDDARQAYEEIIGAEINVPLPRAVGSSLDKDVPLPVPVPAESAENPCSQAVTATSLGQAVSQPTLSLMMRHAERNDCRKISEALQQDNSLINLTDQYGWSLLMVAACAGAFDAVELLLHSGADVKLRDKSGRSCISLARRKGHHNIVNLILRFCKTNSEPKVSPEGDTAPPLKLQLCAACNIKVYESQKQSHLTSTVHQLSQCSKGCRTYYSIPNSNRGYQLMLKHGWDGENGLGPSGSGAKFPPKTILKRDRKGIGASKDPARITHFQSNDYKAVSGKRTKRPQNKIHLKQQMDRDRLLETSLRRELN